MNITIHRGTKQIGGCVTEIESNGYKVFIDYGEQLPGTNTEYSASLQIDGLTHGDVSKSALFITHYHGDHIGAIGDTDPGLPIHVGKTALAIYKCLKKRLSKIPDPTEAEKHKIILERIKTIQTFTDRQKIHIGGITVTPLFVDHSAFDAYMFIVETDQKRVLHTGDFRSHGFKGKALVSMLEAFCTNIDYIICEGSNILRPEAACQTEHDLQNDFETQFKNYKYNFVLVSSTNIDRIFALYHAAKNAKRCFVCDEYQAGVLKTVSSHHKNLDFYKIDYKQWKNPCGRFLKLLQDKKNNRFLFTEKLKNYLDKYGFCMLIRAKDSFKSILDQYYQSDKSKIYYSMWKGYLDKTKPAFSASLFDFFKPYAFEYKHTSGHADVQTLKTVFETVKPKCGIIPIHTDAPEKFNDLFPDQKIILLRDGHVFSCDALRYDPLH